MADAVVLYNAIVALPEDDATALIRYRETNGQLPPSLPRIEWASDVWRDPNGFIVWDVQSARLDDLDTLLAAYPEARVYGAWDWITGEAVREVRPDCLEIVPDIVTFEDNGEESRSRPDRLRDVHLWDGQHPRQWQP